MGTQVYPEQGQKGRERPRKPVFPVQIAQDQHGDQGGPDLTLHHEGGSQVLGPAAVPLVQPDDVESPLLGHVRRPQHVVRLASAFQSVHEEQGGAPFGIGLPVGVAEELRSGATVKETRFNRDVGGQSRSRPESWEQQHQVGVSDQGMGNERAHQERESKVCEAESQTNA